MGNGCVVCGCNEYETILNLNCGGFDNSPLYETANVVSCDKCGHIYNLLTDQQIDGLYNYYSNEYSQANIESPNKNGDTPGSLSKDSMARYENLFKAVENDINKDSFVLDVGCAIGGLLNSLSSRCDNLFGIDCTQNFVDIAEKRLKNVGIRLASAESIPFQDNSFDIVFADQVVEHLIDPNIFFKETNRVLKENGTLCISVPNAMLYRETSFFDFYFFLMREHVHHFSSQSLESIANKSGFTLECETTTFPNLISDVGILPNLTMKFRKDNNVISNGYINRVSDFLIKEYIYDSYVKLSERQKYIFKILESGEPINVYGIGREFHYLWRNTLLSKCNVTLYDDTPIKQKMTIDGNPVFPPDVLNMNAKSTIITSFAHIDSMSQKLRNLGFQGEIL